MQIEFDPSKRDLTLLERGLDFMDAAIVFAGVNITLMDARQSYGEERLITFGGLNGRWVLVVWTPRGEEGDIPHIISARKAENHEEKSWARHFRK
jgi:uncharacterized DUF497 family protein